MVLPSSYGGQPREMTVVCVVLGPSGPSLTNNSLECIQCLASRFSFNHPCLLGAELFTYPGHLSFFPRAAAYPNTWPCSCLKTWIHWKGDLSFVVTDVVTLIFGALSDKASNVPSYSEG